MGIARRVVIITFINRHWVRFFNWCFSIESTNRQIEKKKTKNTHTKYVNEDSLQEMTSLLIFCARNTNLRRCTRKTAMFSRKKKMKSKNCTWYFGWLLCSLLTQSVYIFCILLFSFLSYINQNGKTITTLHRLQWDHRRINMHTK